MFALISSRIWRRNGIDVERSSSNPQAFIPDSTVKRLALLSRVRRELCCAKTRVEQHKTNAIERVRGSIPERAFNGFMEKVWPSQFTELRAEGKPVPGSKPVPSSQLLRVASAAR